MYLMTQHKAAQHEIKQRRHQRSAHRLQRISAGIGAANQWRRGVMAWRKKKKSAETSLMSASMWRLADIKCNDVNWRISARKRKRHGCGSDSLPYIRNAGVAGCRKYQRHQRQLRCGRRNQYLQRRNHRRRIS